MLRENLNLLHDRFPLFFDVLCSVSCAISRIFVGSNPSEWDSFPTKSSICVSWLLAWFVMPSSLFFTNPTLISVCYSGYLFCLFRICCCFPAPTNIATIVFYFLPGDIKLPRPLRPPPTAWLRFVRTLPAVFVTLPAVDYTFLCNFTSCCVACF